MAQDMSLYRAFGIDFQSAIALPEMRTGWEGTADPVTLVRAAAPRPIASTEIERGVAAGPGIFWMEVPGIVRLLVIDGREIAVEILNDATDGEVRAYLLGSAMGALLHQRGLLPLHASAVEIAGRAVAFAGMSGAGKSTIALHLNRRGHLLVSDDICAVDTSGPAPVIWPGLCNLKLWREALASAGHRPEGLEQVLPTLDKYRLPVAATAPYRPYRLDNLCSLVAGPDGSIGSFEPLGGAEAAGVLIGNIFRGQLVIPMQRSRAHFDQTVYIARQAGIYRLTRPWSLDQLEASCSLVESLVAVTS
jgi:hypothetical protein